MARLEDTLPGSDGDAIRGLKCSAREAEGQEGVDGAGNDGGGRRIWRSVIRIRGEYARADLGGFRSRSGGLVLCVVSVVGRPDEYWLCIKVRRDLGGCNSVYVTYRSADDLMILFMETSMHRYPWAVD